MKPLWLLRYKLLVALCVLFLWALALVEGAGPVYPGPEVGPGGIVGAATSERPRLFKPGDSVTVYANKLTSVETVLPYPYFYAPFCRPEKIDTAQVFPGEQLLGTITQSTIYNFQFKKDVDCAVPCKNTLKSQQLRTMEFLIENGYVGNLIIDGLPCSRVWTNKGTELTELLPGFPIGGMLEYSEADPDSDNNNQYTTYRLPLLYNHIDFTILYSEAHEDKEDVGIRAEQRDDTTTTQPPPTTTTTTTTQPPTTTTTTTTTQPPTTTTTTTQQPPSETTTAVPPTTYAIVGCHVQPRSIQHEDDADIQPPTTSADPRACGKGEFYGSPQLVNGVTNTTIYWTYSVQWTRANLAWEDRWKPIIDSNAADNLSFHWFFIVNSSLITLILSGTVMYILFRTLSYRFRNLDNQTEDSEIEKRYLAEDDTGWKLLHGDVFRPPPHPILLSAAVGTGAQFFLTALALLLAGMSGMFTAKNGGSGIILTYFITVLAVTSIFAGYFSGHLYKMLKGHYWLRNSLVTAFLFPSYFMMYYLSIDVIFAVQESSASLSFVSLLALLAVWFFVAVPLTGFGGYLASKQGTVAFPVEVNQIPRQIPQQPWYTRPAITIGVGGLIPFAVIFSEMFFFFSSYWNGYFYTTYVPIIVAFLLLMISSAEISIVLVFNQFGREDYHWWWRAYLSPASSGVYLFLYSLFFLVFRTNIRRAASVSIFLGYSFMLSVFLALLVGGFSFGVCFFFVRKIYSSLRID